MEVKELDGHWFTDVGQTCRLQSEGLSGVSGEGARELGRRLLYGRSVRAPGVTRDKRLGAAFACTSLWPLPWAICDARSARAPALPSGLGRNRVDA